MNQKHTAGEWIKGTQYSNGEMHIGVILPNGYFREVAVCQPGPDREVNANAELIAAAPNMAAALIKAEIATRPFFGTCRGCGSDYFEDPNICKHIEGCAWLEVRAALDKAGVKS